MKNTTKGAWIIHHGLKTKADTNGGADFSAIDTAAKAGTLFTQICRSTETEIPKEKVRAYARAINLNPNLELNSILSILKTHRLIDESDNTIVSIGGSTTTALESTAKIFDEQDKIEEEEAAVLLAEHLSDAPLSDGELLDFLYSKFDFKENRSRDLLSRAENIGFVDAEPEGTEKLFFNGNLFRNQDIKKVKAVVDSFTTEEATQFRELEEKLRLAPLSLKAATAITSADLMKKIRSVGLVDVSFLENEHGQFGYVTLPSSFHKFANPFVDDAFDLAKALVAALSYGMSQSSSSRGKIWGISLLLGKLIRGGSVGPAPAIGNDYKLLEQRGVVEVFPDGRSFSMRLLKRDVGEIALAVLTRGTTEDKQVEEWLPQVSMSGFVTPSESRQTMRKNRSLGLKRVSNDVLTSLRTRKS